MSSPKRQKTAAAGVGGDYFAGIPAKIPYEGPDSKNALAFKYYNVSLFIVSFALKDFNLR